MSLWLDCCTAGMAECTHLRSCLIAFYLTYGMAYGCANYILLFFWFWNKTELSQQGHHHKSLTTWPQTPGQDKAT